jgi:hypothetical protein
MVVEEGYGGMSYTFKIRSIMFDQEIINLENIELQHLYTIRYPIAFHYADDLYLVMLW